MDNILKEHCNVLGVTPGASAQEVKQAYRDLAKVWHPDRFQDSPRLSRQAEEKLKQINDAYEALKDGVPFFSPDDETPDLQSSEKAAPSTELVGQSSGCAVAATTFIFLWSCLMLPDRRGQAVQKLVDPGGWLSSAKYETVWETSWSEVVFLTAFACVMFYWSVRWLGFMGFIAGISILGWFETPSEHRSLLFWLYILGLVYFTKKFMRRSVSP